MDALTQLGTLFSSGTGKGIATAAELGTAGAGAVGNILNNKERSDDLSQLKKQEAALTNPATINSMVKSETQPLNQALVQSVGNQVSGTLAEQGLSQAPGIQGTVLAQALAPAELQNQQNALQLVMKQLGLPVEYAQTLLAGLPPNTNLAPLLALLQQQGKGGAPGAPGGASSIAALLNLLRQQPSAQTSQTQLPNTLQQPSVPPANDDLIFPPDTSSWLPPAIESAPPLAASFGG